MKTNPSCNPNLTVAALRKAGNKVRVIHMRRFVPDLRPVPLKPFFDRSSPGDFAVGRDVPIAVVKFKVSSIGGVTVVQLTTNKGKNYEAESRANSTPGHSDCYNKKSGVKKCLARIYGQVGEKLFEKTTAEVKAAKTAKSKK